MELELFRSASGKTRESILLLKSDYASLRLEIDQFRVEIEKSFVQFEKFCAERLKIFSFTLKTFEKRRAKKMKDAYVEQLDLNHNLQRKLANALQQLKNAEEKEEKSTTSKTGYELLESAYEHLFFQLQTTRNQLQKFQQLQTEFSARPSTFDF